MRGGKSGTALGACPGAVATDQITPTPAGALTTSQPLPDDLVATVQKLREEVALQRQEINGLKETCARLQGCTRLEERYEENN